MKKLNIKNPRMLAFLTTGLALLVAIITSSIAWFTASGAATVSTRALTLTAKDSAAMLLEVPDLAAEYERYMGETGTEYDGEDSPYLVEYTPVIIEYSEDENSAGKYLTYYFDSETSYIQRVIQGSAPITFTSDDLWDNFTMNLVELSLRVDENEEPVLDEEDNEIYDPTGVEYYGENGYFRKVGDGTLLQLTPGKHVYTLNIYFQGDVGYHLLQATHADIDDEYAFDYCDELFMFATFHLNATFNMVDLHDLVLSGSHIYDGAYNTIDSHSIAFDVSGGTTVSMNFTGFSLQKADGTYEVLRVPELLDDGNVDYAYYFKDWISSYTDDEDVTTYYHYRATKANGTPDSVVTLSMRPLRGATETLSSCWGESYVLSFGNVVDAIDECYVRPQGTYYPNAGYLTYVPGTKSLSVNNPRGGQVSASNAAGTSSGISNTIPAPEREGYRFLGWSLTEPASDYAADDDVSGLTYAFTSGNNYRYDFGASGNGHDLTLYAVWQELGVNVTFVVDGTWGHNYATVVGDHITYKGVNYDFDNNTVTLELPKHTDLSTITATGVATIGDVQRNLTLKCWNYLSSGVYYGADDSYDIEEDVTVYAMWNERAEHTITMDASMDSSANAYMSMATTNEVATNIEHYTLQFAGYYEPMSAEMSIYAGTLKSATIKTYLGVKDIDHQYNLVVTVLEGMTWNDVNASVTFTVLKVGTTQYSLSGWYENATDGNDFLPTSWGTLKNRNATTVVGNAAITENKQLVARFS